ncbi:MULTISPECIES: hypothetical protein [Burkholderia]|uniref:Transcriptional regulator n=1 Tax=Burkholderia humptydooensis TaxID=430531 RepID=A0A7U4SRA0_9BURK|nr:MULTISPECIES: hypothetical protein [Burkholderia]AJY41646.1 hypothetical protein BW21_841 [Burkholderia sp. 2002721687]ALX41596.1 transcriptional regulator [Burkholderia humptydooensis]KVN14272.1 transcriptional regulator [Burkholderia sp. MSMB1552]KWZ56895.1 transcriptional regulator [Burkholderia sp. MSMB1588]QPS43232.1 transcriptional regulator [Burkholderia humptydooensis]
MTSGGGPRTQGGRVLRPEDAVVDKLGADGE